MKAPLVFALVVLALAACDEKKEAPAHPSSGQVEAIPVASMPPVVSAMAPVAPSAVASAAVPPSIAVTGEGTEDVSFTAKEPGKDTNQTVKAKAGGAFTLFLPDRDGNTWAADSVGAAGKPKEEVIPGFAPGAMGHQFKWTGLKAGKTALTFGLRKASAKGKGEPTQTFKLTLEVE